MSTSRSSAGEESASGQSLDQRERQELIRERVIADGFVRSEQLAEEFSVTLMTIHRDLDVLQQQGWLRKVRGGATAQPSALFHGDIRYRMQAMREAKEKLARTAIKMITRGQSIILDESTTALHLAQLLPEHGPITVITNFLAIIKLLAGKPGIDLVALGGAYYPAYDAFLGLHTAESVRSLRADVLFMSTTAITDGICYHQTQDTIIVKRALIETAAKRVLLVDHSKLSKRGIFQLAPLTAFDLVIVDDGISKQDLDAMILLGAKIHIAGTESVGGQELLDLLSRDR
jgi:DeoR/GlpR family transcriptional regulator of sugar metabolism